MTPVEQLELMDGGKPFRAEQPVATEVIYRQSSMLSAIRLAIQASGLEEKEVYMPLGIDKAQWSRIMSGQAHFPTNMYEHFCDLVGNEIVLVWFAFRRGKGLHDLEDAKDKRIRELEEQVADQGKEIQTLVKYGVLRAVQK